jgi:hypothetical protein
MCALAAAPATAQRSIHLGLGGGAAFPVGNLDTAFTPGPSGLVTLAMGPQESPLGFRLDYQYSGFSGKAINGAETPDMHIASVNANVVFAFRAGYAKPYLIAGYGLYPFRAPQSTKSENDWGANAGAGIAFPLPFTGVGGFIEARYHDVNRSDSSPYHFIPVTFGVMF